MGNRRSGLKSGANATAHGAHQQRQTINFCSNLNVQRVFLTNCFQPAAQTVAWAGHYQWNTRQLGWGNIVIGNISQ